METREITQGKLYVLYMNHVRDRWEDSTNVAVSTDYQQLVDWVNSFRVEPYRSEKDLQVFGQSFLKVYAEGSPLEYYNAPDSLDLEQYNGKGITFDWIPLQILEKILNSDRWLVVCRD